MHHSGMAFSSDQWLAIFLSLEDELTVTLEMGDHRIGDAQLMVNTIEKSISNCGALRPQHRDDGGWWLYWHPHPLQILESVSTHVRTETTHTRTPPRGPESNDQQSSRARARGKETNDG